MPITFEQILACHPENPDNFNALLANVSVITPFVGAGLSIPPYQTWRQTLLNIAKKAASPKLISEIQTLMNKGQFEEVASLLLKRRGPRRFDDDFIAAFDSKKLNDATLSDTVQMLPWLWSGAAVTTNFDRTLEETYIRHGNPFIDRCIPRKDDCSVLLDRIQVENKHYLLKLHGDIENFRQRTLTLQEYEELYGDIEKDIKANSLKPCPSMLRDFYKNKRFLFLGCSLASDRTLRVLRLLTGRGDVRHFAILELPEKTKSMEDDCTAVIADPLNGEKWTQLEEQELHLSNHNITPIWYPHGKHEAAAVLLRKLLEECQKQGVPLPSPGAELDAFPFRHPHGFYGRDEKVRDVLQALSTSPIVCIYGAPGIGKSEVCEEVMYQRTTPHNRHITVYLQGAFGFASLLEKMGQALSMPPESINEQAILERLKQVAREKSTLLYLDNFEDALCNDEHRDTGAPDAETLAFLGNAEMVTGLSILLSCRERVTGRFTWIEIAPLKLEFAWKLFHQVWVSQGGNAERLEHGKTYAEQLIRALDYHPLSIVLMASQAAEVASTKALLDAWSASCEIGAVISPTIHNDNHKSLNAAIRTSYLQIQKDSLACAIWGICSLVPGSLRKEVLEMLLHDESNLQIAITRLIRLNLLAWADDIIGEPLRYIMLAPIKRQVFTYITGNQHGSETYTLNMLGEFYKRLLHAAQPGQDSWGDASRFVLSILDDILYFERYVYNHEVWDLFTPIYSGLFNYYQFRSAEGVRIICDVIALHEQGSLSLPVLLLAQSKEYYGDLQRRLGKVDDALALYTEAETLFLSERDNLGRANVLKSMGDLQSRLGKVDEALALYTEAETLFLSERDNLGRANVLKSMGDLQSRLGKVDEALALYTEAETLFLSERANLGRANVLKSMGDLQSRLGKVDEALALYTEAETLFLSERANLGRANVLKSMGDLQSRLGKVDEALALYTEAETLFLSERANLGHANVLKNMGDLQSRLGKVDEALALYTEAETLFLSERANLGRANVLKSMGDLQSRLGKVDEALALYTEAETLFLSERANLGRANVLKSMGDLQSRLGKVDEALALYTEAETLFLSERDNLGRANVLQSMGDLQSRLGKVDEALALYTEAETLFLSERDNLGRANVLQSMGDLFQASSDLQSAQENYEAALLLYLSEQDITGRGYTLSELCLIYAKQRNFEIMQKVIDDITSLIAEINYPSVKEYILQKMKEAQQLHDTFSN